MLKSIKWRENKCTRQFSLSSDAVKMKTKILIVWFSRRLLWVMSCIYFELWGEITVYNSIQTIVVIYLWGFLFSPCPTYPPSICRTTAFSVGNWTKQRTYKHSCLKADLTSSEVLKTTGVIVRHKPRCPDISNGVPRPLYQVHILCFMNDITLGLP